MINPRIIESTGFRLVGMKVRMTMNDNQTAKLWQSFMPRLKEINRDNNLGLYSVQVYPEGFGMHTRDMLFDKWAATRSEDPQLPNGMDELLVPAGLYAVFIHQGPISTFPQTIQHIFNVWMPDSDYVLDRRPQFEIMGPRYKGEHPDSEEEVWIPIDRRKS